MKKLIYLLLLLASTLATAQVVVLKHTAYEIHFDAKLKEPLFTHYILTKQMLDGSFDRTSFKPDPLLKKDLQGSAKDYKNSAYDKGHLSPDADFRYNETAQLQAMYYTNCAPQNSYLNRGTWKSLENHCRDLAKIYDVEIWTGCIYDGSNEYLGKLIVPTFYWKLIQYNGVYEAYKMPNINPDFKDFIKYKIDENELLKLIE